MKWFIGLTMVLLTAACMHPKTYGNSATGQTSTTSPSKHNATVTSEFKNIGCDFLLKVKKDTTTLTCYPLNLDEQYKKDGQKLYIKYKITKVRVKGPCYKGIPIHITKVRRIP